MCKQNSSAPLKHFSLPLLFALLAPTFLYQLAMPYITNCPITLETRGILKINFSKWEFLGAKSFDESTSLPSPSNQPLLDWNTSVWHPEICMKAFFHILLFNSCIQRSARTGAWHAFTCNTHVNHKPARNSQNHNISLVILLGLLPTPMEQQLQSLTGILHLGFRHLVTHIHSNTEKMFWPYIIIFLLLSLWFWKVIWHLWAPDISFSSKWKQNDV